MKAYPFLAFLVALMVTAGLLTSLGVITPSAFVVTWLAASVAVVGVLMVAARDHLIRRTGAGLLGAVALGVALFVHLGAAHAATAAIAPPPGDDGFWAWINGYLTEGVILVVGTVATWALTQIATRTRFQLRTDQEASLRETLKTGAFATMSELELQIDKRWTLEQRQAVIAKMVSWAESRATAELRKLGLPGIVVNAMAGKVLESLLTAYPFLDVSSGSPLISDGNPGSTPALDRAAGGNGGA